MNSLPLSRSPRRAGLFGRVLDRVVPRGGSRRPPPRARGPDDPRGPGGRSVPRRRPRPGPWRTSGRPGRASGPAVRRRCGARRGHGTRTPAVTRCARQAAGSPWAGPGPPPQPTAAAAAALARWESVRGDEAGLRYRLAQDPRSSPSCRLDRGLLWATCPWKVPMTVRERRSCDLPRIAAVYDEQVRTAISTFDLTSPGLGLLGDAGSPARSPATTCSSPTPPPTPRRLRRQPRRGLRLLVVVQTAGVRPPPARSRSIWSDAARGQGLGRAALRRAARPAARRQHAPGARGGRPARTTRARRSPGVRLGRSGPAEVGWKFDRWIDTACRAPRWRSRHRGAVSLQPLLAGPAVGEQPLSLGTTVASPPPQPQVTATYVSGGAIPGISTRRPPDQDQVTR